MTTTSHESDHNAVLAVFKTFLGAIERKDARAAIDMFDDQPITFDFAPPLENRFDALDDPKGLEEWFDTWAGAIHTDIGSPTVVVSGDLAVIHGLQRLHGQKNEGDLSMWYRSTVVLSQRLSGWRITHIHNSVPMAMDGSRKALTDLTPM